MWTIRLTGDGLIAEQGKEVKATVTLNNKGSDSVSIRFEDAPALNYDMGGGLNAAVGYIRGVERSAMVYAKETGRTS